MAILERVKGAVRALRGVPAAASPGRERAGDEIGWGGTALAAGIVNDEHNAALKGRSGIQAATKMRRSNAQVRAVEKVVSLPIRGTAWMVRPPKDAGSAEKEAAELLQENLFGGMETSWDDLIREAALAIYYGFRVPEIVWEERGGMVAVRKLGSRNPELIERWLYDGEGRLAGYLYVGTRPKGDGVTDSYGSVGMTERLPVPLERTLHFAYDQENENPQGMGLWRSMYPHWYILDTTYKILSVGLERNLLGVPYGMTGSGSQPDDRSKLLTVLQRLRAAHDGAFVIPHGTEVGWFESERDIMDAMPFVHHQMTMIAMAGLAQFLNLGMGAVGTQAVGTVHAAIFESCADANARWIEQTINSQLVKRWVRLNYGEGLRAPEVAHRPIKSRDLNVWANALSAFVGGGLLHPTPDDEGHLRATFELPEIPKEQLVALEADRQAQEAERRKAELAKLQGGVPAKADDEPRQARERIDLDALTFAEDDDAERQARERAERGFETKARELLESVQDGYVAALRPLVEAAQGGEKKIAQGKPIDKLPDVKVPGERRYTEFVRSFLWQVFDQGRQALAEETGQDGKRPVSNRLRQWINARAELIASDHLSQMRTAVLSRVLSGLRAELDTELIFSDVGAVALSEFSRNTERSWGEAAAELLSMIGEE